MSEFAQDNYLNTAPSAGPQTSRRAEEIDNHLLQINFAQAAQVETLQDPTLAYQLQRHAFGVHTNVKFGRVQACLPHANWYKVALDDMGGELPCTRLGNCGGYRYFGARDVSNITPDSKVVVIVHNAGSYGVIVGVVPEITEDSNHTYSDWVVQGSNVGILRNKYYTEYLQLLSDEGGAIVSSNGAPLDATSLDYTQTTETGLQIHLDPFMVYLRVDEGCGVFGFYHDRALRIAGEQIDVWSGARVEEDRNDEGESTTFRGETPYSWELSGSLKPGSDVSTETSDSDVLHNAPKAKLEPSNQKLAPFSRYQEHGGYTGQGKIRQMVIPDPSAGDVNLYDSKDNDVCLFREQISLDGGYAMASAKQVFIARRALIPNPRRLRPSSDYSSNCDSSENNNYKFAGVFGNGDEHKIGDVSVDYPERNLLSAAAILDLHAHAFNWKGIHAFHYHKKDFYLPQESESVVSSSQYLPPFNLLAYDTWLPTPEPEQLKVDHRYNNVKFWKLMQHISLTDDGAIVIQAGQGEEIKLSGGGIQISAPGHILIQSGSTTAVLAGDDFIARANNSADITATNKDVRIKGHVNTQILAGNSGEGCLLLENRAKADVHDYPVEGGETIRGSGIVFKAKNAVVATLAKNVYLRSGIDGGVGEILLDAKRGDNAVRVMANRVERFAKFGFRDVIGVPQAQTVNTFNANQTILGAELRVQGSIHASGMGLFRGSVISTDAHIYSSIGGQVSRLRNRQELNVTLDRIQELHSKFKSEQQDTYDYDIKARYYESKQIGEDDTIKKVSFSLRPEKQYGTDNFKLPQVHWQTLNTAVGAGKPWKEEDVLYQESVKYQPWPGKKAWSEKPSFLSLPASSFKMYDVAKGTAKDRPGPYEVAATGSFVPAVPSSAYFIIPSEG